MSRVKGGAASRARHKKVLKMAKGYRGRAKSCFRTAIQKVEKGLQYQYRDRKNRKRTFRRLWIVRINAAARINGISYSKLIHAMKEKDMQINRKVLADLAIHDADTFAAIVKEATA